MASANTKTRTKTKKDKAPVPAKGTDVKASASPAKPKDLGKPFSVQRQKVLKDLTKRLTKSKEQLKAKRAECRQLNETVKALDEQLIDELQQNTELLPFPD